MGLNHFESKIQVSNSYMALISALNCSTINSRLACLTCMKPVQMDRLDFSDHFSYIICLIWSYGLISMNFRSFGHFLNFLNNKNPKMSYCISTASL